MVSLSKKTINGQGGKNMRAKTRGRSWNALSLQNLYGYGWVSKNFYLRLCGFARFILSHNFLKTCIEIHASGVL